MATASRAVRKLRRIKRERTLAWRLVKAAYAQAEMARKVAVGLETELKKRDAETKAEGIVTDSLLSRPKSKVIITKLEDEIVKDDQVDRQD